MYNASRHLSINGNGSLLARPNEDPLLIHLGELTGVVQQHLKTSILCVFHLAFLATFQPVKNLESATYLSLSISATAKKKYQYIGQESGL